MERPISPFMFPKWYRFQITSALSILHHLCNGIRHLAWMPATASRFGTRIAAGARSSPRRAVLTILAWLYVFLV